MSSVPVLIISLDGLRPDFYLGSRYDVPCLKRLMKLGCHATGVEPVYPSLTYPNHTTLVTGVKPAVHGIVSNSRFDWSKGPLSDWFWEARWIRSPTLWQLARAAGKKVGIVRWPVTVGAECDWLIPEVFSADHETPQSNFELALRHSTPGLLQTIFSRTVSETPMENLARQAGRREHDQWAASAASYLLSEMHPDLLLVHLIEVDHMQHEFGRDSPELADSLKAANHAIERILEAVNLEHTRVAIVGDHGFRNFRRLFRVNQVLEEAGFVTSGTGWRAVAHVDGGIAAVYVREPRDGDSVLRLLGLQEGEAFRIRTRAELDLLGAFPGALCALDPVEGVSLKAGVGQALWQELERTEGRHGELPSFAGAVFAGPGIRAGSTIGQITMQELGGLFAQWVGVEFSVATPPGLSA